jgi:uncharacterized membrane protein (Fun14 family)
MDARPPIQSDSLPVRLVPAVLVLIGAAILLISVPAAVAVISIVNDGLFDGPQRWLSSGLALATPYLELARLGMTLALAIAVSTAKEDR